MVDSTLMDEMKASIKAERKRELSKKLYNGKIHNNPEFYAAEKERIKAYKKNRYNNDPEFAALMKQRAKDAYQKAKAKKLAAASICPTNFDML
jgi:CRISPR/Cas system-associated endonuclease Cas1